jgi:hypothetical protein
MRSLPTIALSREYQLLVEHDGFAALSPGLLLRLWQEADLPSVRRLAANVPPSVPYEVLVGESLVSMWLDDHKLSVISRGGWRPTQEMTP